MKIQENPLYFFYLNSMCKPKLLNRICKRYYSRSTQYYNEIEKKNSRLLLLETSICIKQKKIVHNNIFNTQITETFIIRHMVLHRHSGSS